MDDLEAFSKVNIKVFTFMHVVNKDGRMTCQETPPQLLLY
jgi:hypothetical protein